LPKIVQAREHLNRVILTIGSCCSDPTEGEEPGTRFLGMEFDHESQNLDTQRHPAPGPECALIQLRRSPDAAHATYTAHTTFDKRASACRAV